MKSVPSVGHIDLYMLYWRAWLRDGLANGPARKLLAFQDWRKDYDELLRPAAPVPALTDGLLQPTVSPSADVLPASP